MSAILTKTLWMYLLAAVVSFFIAFLIRLLGVALGRTASNASVPTQPSSVVTSASAAAAIGISAEEVAAIAAAVTAVIGSHLIVHIEPTRGGRGWVGEGRADHHDHAIARHRHGSGAD